jgi:tetratricopeptide (TPR) repeat protein
MIGRCKVTVALLTAVLALVPHGVVSAQEAPGAGDRAVGTLANAEIDAETARELFLEGNALYAEGAYEEAAARYERITQGGFENADVHYNLANARYKSGQTARAVLGYERALLLDPSHDDARSNLAFVRSQLADRQGPAGGETSPFLEGLVRAADIGTLTVATSLFYFLLVAGAIVGVLRRVFPPWLVRSIVVLVVLTALSASALGFRLYGRATDRGAIVTAADVAVRTGPGEDFVLEFRLHEGTKVRLMESRDDWSRISVRGTDLEGWLPSSTVEAIEWR